MTSSEADCAEDITFFVFNNFFSVLKVHHFKGIVQYI